MKKVYLSIFLIFAILLTSQNILFAVQPYEEIARKETLVTYNIKQQANDKLVPVSAPTINQKITSDSGMNSIISNISGVVMYLCMAAAIIVLIIKGVQLMNSAPEGKAEIKKQMIAVIIGVALVFATASILRIISQITDNLF